ncbi:grasp-with-spasm system ATP-grasp peptide maturase [Chryseobacterium chendengshani]|uniref:grasp-with-spasm system ATP-grasp peptide maturase n=1 Tax=Chryseobacterium sp. LJ756 TaxID=2864113 RepID=UPI001C64423B|nr:grasp-with-spasm system ATP-grasp peptide maturase [Chryseobacterium sp. LJ756]MBW7675409.1 grasp-with-spasm system ATP-grasp peptide maturase [Chryseobacterium sp. LJ756]
MFVVLSQATFETSTDLVCKWLEYFGVDYTRINGEDLFKINSLNLYKDKEDISLIWFRRKISGSPIEISVRSDRITNKGNVISKLKSFCSDEFNELYSFFLNGFNQDFFINNPFMIEHLNKLSVLFKAKEFGLSIPDTGILTSKDELSKWVQKYKEIIVKPLSQCIVVNVDDHIYKMFTTTINIKNVNRAPNYFSPSLIQEKISKKLEIRTFYIFDEFYSMAIFSQSNKKTKEDFRNYDFDNPNRTVPYKLPVEIEEKISKLMKSLGLNMGSIDLMLTEDNIYYFLEINPEGQFGMVSYPCNYHLEKRIAQIAQKNEKKIYNKTK